MQRIPTLRPVTLESLEKEKFGPRPSRTANASQAEEEDAVIKFTRSSKKKRAKLSVLKKKEPQVVPGDPSEGPCGLGCITIACCQRFNSIRWFMAFYCVLLVSQGIVFGLIDLSNNDFEQHHILTITEQIALTLSYDISSCLMVLFIAYYGGSGNRTKWIALSSFLVGLGSLLLAFPYFGGRKYKSQVKAEDICSMAKSLHPCLTSKSSFKTKYITFFTLGQIDQGIAGMPLYILGITFLDDSVSTHTSGIYLGTADAATILGYALGLALGAPQPKSTQNNTSPAESVVDYVGNVQQEKKWWLNFLFVSLLAWSTLLPFLCFPYSIAGTAKIKARKQREFRLYESHLIYWKLGASIKDLFGTVWILLKNPVFMCQALSKASESLIIIGASEFLPIYLETQFMLTPTMATILTGLILIPAGALGHLLGGIIACQLEMSCKALMRFIIVSSTISIIFFGIVIFVHCDPVRFAGISENYNGTGQLGNLTAPCNDQCKCSTSLYSSVCGRDNIEYFSPCFAGCIIAKTIKNQKKYYKCSCIKEGLTTADVDGDFIDAVLGKCDMNCYKLPLFFAFIFSAIVFSGFCSVPINLIIFRIVPDKLHSLALGITYVVMRIFGTIPGPALFKITGETSCTFRDTNRCGYKGRCWVYNKTKMAFILMGMCSICKVLTIFFTVIGFNKYSSFVKAKKEILLRIFAKSIKSKRKKKTNL